MLGVLDDVQVVRVYRQDRRVIERLGEKIVIGEIQFMDVGAFHLSFIRAVAQSNALHERVGGGLQVNKQIGLLDFFRERFMHFVIHIEFITLDVDTREKRIFGEEIGRASCRERVRRC